VVKGPWSLGNNPRPTEGVSVHLTGGAQNCPDQHRSDGHPPDVFPLSPLLGESHLRQVVVTSLSPLDLPAAPGLTPVAYAGSLDG
jgi:hypothetical protein